MKHKKLRGASAQKQNEVDEPTPPANPPSPQNADIGVGSSDWLGRGGVEAPEVGGETVRVIVGSGDESSKAMNALLKDGWIIAASYFGVNGHKQEFVLIKSKPNLRTEGFTSVDELQQWLALIPKQTLE